MKREKETLLVKKRTFLPKGHLPGCVLIVHKCMNTQRHTYTQTTCTPECETQPAAV